MKPIEKLSFADVTAMKKYIEDNLVIKGSTERLYNNLEMELKKRIDQLKNI